MIEVLDDVGWELSPGGEDPPPTPGEVRTFGLSGAGAPPAAAWLLWRPHSLQDDGFEDMDADALDLMSIARVSQIEPAADRRWRARILEAQALIDLPPEPPDPKLAP